MATPDPTAPGAPARALVDRHRALAGTARRVLDHLDGATVRVAALVEQDREARVRAELASVGIEQLGALTDRNLRLRALTDAGYATAADLLGVPAATLDRVPGVGTQTARGVVAAVEQLAAAVREGVPVRLEVDRSGRPDSATTAEVLRLLDRLLRLRPVVERHREALAGYADAVAAHAASAAPATNRLRFALTRRPAKARARRALAALDDWSGVVDRGLGAEVERLAAACAAPDTTGPALWDVFERRSAELYTVLGSIVPLAQDVLAARGMLTAELAERVAAHPLDQSLLRVPLRGYQAFGARFALNQGRALLGDEMGLGKTIQALAVIADRAAGGDRHFLVVCPAGVLVNWLRETTARTALPAHRLHGPSRAEAVARWHAEGGVGVTTFEALPHLPLDGPPLGLLVVDEAHYVKHPSAQRSKAVAAWAAATWRVLLLTGTPMDNRIEDFVALVRLLDADLAAGLPRHLGLVGADAFRRAVAPVYLRRNQADVLMELPELVQVDEWEDLSPAGEEVYRAAVATGNFMAMRRAAYLTADPAESAKLARLVEIVAEAGASGHRTVVFSYFRSVLDVVARALDPRAYGPITGDVPADERQAVIDAFSAGPRDGVLVAQITVGGVGLNLQAASVAVLCEPQLTPAAEAQAVARLHRMGQVRTVVAHRLLAEDGVDERIVELLAGKRRVFDAYVRESAVAASAVAAVDVTEAGLAREVVAMEQARLGYGPVWESLGGPDSDGAAATAG
ncbi:DEAD/DEAH box helicase [Cellulomonas hominis]|uniref:DEAD/DEAH box helicase n=1 Tax=Cellulomonas hominis TaxID=156981 RepID=UPI001443F1FE|nr:DEAD/DEAH box helicase [Cellulomonas hominis]NKY08875.1 DEAD/DEAH box helicase [Cellulomonas hominis]